MFTVRHKIKSLENYLTDKKKWGLVKIDKPIPQLIKHKNTNNPDDFGIHIASKAVTNKWYSIYMC